MADSGPPTLADVDGDFGKWALRLLAYVKTPEHKQRLAEEEAARTDPWRWYCRICGAEWQDDSRIVRNDQAREHLAGTTCGRGTRLGEAEAGRLSHVWTY